MIHDDIKVAVLLKKIPKELRDHFAFESPQLANVDSRFPVMREFVQNWCHFQKTFALLRPSVEIAAVSTAASESESIVSALGWHGS